MTTIITRPYTGPDDESLPDNVKELPEDKRAQWVNVFNSAFETCMEGEGGEETACEESAFAQAWGTVEEGEEEPEEEGEEEPASRGLKIFQVFDRILKRFKRPANAARAVGLSDLYWAVAEAVYAEDDYAWVMDVYHDGGDMFAVIAKDAKLFRVGVKVNGSEVSIDETWQQVTMEFVPVAGSEEDTESVAQMRSKTTLRQMDDGRWRWFSISSTSILNRAGEIDSRKLFDNFVKHIEEGEDYPIRMFFHAGESFRIGQVDFVGRDGYCLITSGLYDDSELAQREVQARLKAPDYWGQSIGFLPIGEPELMAVRVDDGTEVNIPVYNDGILKEESTLPETQAAAWMTATPTIQEVNRMLNARQKEAFVTLFDGDEAAADKWLEEHPEARNRMIEEGGMISRSEVDTSTEEPVSSSEEQTSQDEFEVEFDEALIDEIATRVGETFAPLAQSVEEIRSGLDAFSQAQASLQEAVTGLAARVDALETSEEERQSIWLEDLPGKRKAKVTYRPRQNVQPVTPPQEESIEDSVSEILDRIPIKY